MNPGVDAQALLIVEALDRLDTIVLVLGAAKTQRVQPSVLAANAAFIKRVGKQAIGDAESPLSAFLLPESNRATVTAMERAIADGSKLSGEILLAGQPTPFWLGFSLATVAAPGCAAHCVLVGKDITDQVRRAGDDRPMQRLLANAFVSVDAPVAIVTGGDRIVSASQQFARLCGRASADLAGSALTNILDDEVRRRVHTALASAAPGAPVIRFRGGGVQHDGKPFSASFGLSVIEGRASEKLAVVTFQSDPQQEQDPEEHSNALGKIRLLGLREIRVALGAKWPTVAERAMILAEATIRRRLAPHDILSRTTEQEFLIWFHQGTAADNEIIAARIARDVRIVLLTEFVDSLVSSVASATVALPPGTLPGDLPPAAAAELDHRPGLAPDPEMEQARAYLAWVEQELPVDIDQIFGRGGQALPAVWCTIPASVAARLEHVSAKLGSEALGKLELDILQLRTGLAVAQKAAAANIPRSCFVPISCDCLASPRSRTAMADVMAGADTAVGGRLTLLLTGRFATFRPARLQELVAPLRGRVRAVGLAIDAISDLPIEVLQRPFSIIAFRPGTLGSEKAETTLWKALDAIHQAGGKIVARDVTSPNLARMLLELGVDFICGAAPADALVQ